MKLYLGQDVVNKPEPAPAEDPASIKLEETMEEEQEDEELPASRWPGTDRF